MSFLDEFRAAMIATGEKSVSRTDIAKKAYVPNLAQKKVLRAARIGPRPEEEQRLFDIRVAETGQLLGTTYYPAVRSGSGREPEMRMGRGLINWLCEGETVWLGTDGLAVFALKSSSPIASAVDEDQIGSAIEKLGRMLDPRRVMERAKASQGPPGRRVTSSVVFERNAWVREFARQRSNGHCEMPGCDYVGFIKVDGTAYIEVHHITSMARAGFDVIDNVAAICPNCHAKAHYAKDHRVIETQLLAAIRKANDVYVKSIR